MWTNYLGCDVHFKKFSDKCFPITVTAVVSDYTVEIEMKE